MYEQVGSRVNTFMGWNLLKNDANSQPCFHLIVKVIVLCLVFHVDILDRLMPLHKVVIFVQYYKADVSEKEHWVLEAKDAWVVMTSLIVTINNIVVQKSPSD